MDAGKAVPAVQSDIAAADELGLSGTPATFVNGRYLRGSISPQELSVIIEDELRRTALTALR